MQRKIQPSQEASAVRTFFIADVRGYTSFTLQHGDEAAARLAERFMTISREVIDTGDGSIFGQRGDQVLAVFASARQAVRAAIHLQDRLSEERAQAPSLGFAVGVGLDAGEAVPVRDDYFGTAVNLAARLCSLAGPGEVLASETVVNLARKLDGLEYVDRGAAELKGFAAPVKVRQVVTQSGQPDEVEQPTASSIAASPPASADSLPIGNFLGALPDNIMVAREEETARILQLVDAVEDGRGQVVLLAGEPGVGKTRLAQEVTLQVRNRGFLVAAGRCYEQEQGVPFYPWLDALAALYGGAEPDVKQEVPRRWAQLARLLPDAPLVAPPSSDEGLEEQHKLFRAVTAFVTAAAERRPVALFLDDLHWADASTLQLMQHIARHTRAARVLLLGTYRDVEVTRYHPLQAALRDLQREGVIERLDIRRLEASGTAALIGATVGSSDVEPAFVELLYRRTEGNPFFVHQVLNVLRGRDAVEAGEWQWSLGALDTIDVPESVRAVIEQRLIQLPEEAQELLREASVLGQSFAFDDLLATTGRTEQEIEHGLDAAVATGIVREGRGEEYAFNHALTQQTLYGELSARRRRRLHLAAGQALSAGHETRGQERAAELAWHFLEGDDPERAIPALLLAGDQAEAIFAHDEAGRHFRAALEVADEAGYQRHRAEALEKLGRVLRTTGHFDEAIDYLQQASGNYRQLQDLEGEGRAMAQLLTIANMRGASDELVTQARSLLDRLESKGPSKALVALYVEYAQANFRDGVDDALPMLQRAAAMARSLGDDPLVVMAEVRQGLALAVARRTEEARAVLDGLMPLAERTLTFYGTLAVGVYGELLKLAGEFDHARTLRDRQMQRAEQIGDLAQIVASLGQLGEIAFLMGEWTEARSRLEHGLALGQHLQSPHYLAFAMLPLTELEIATGDWDRAETRLETFAEAVRGSDYMNRLLQANRLLAQLDLERGHPDRAIERVEAMWDPSLDEDSSMLLIKTAAEIATGRLNEAERLARHLIELASAQSNRLDWCEALLLHGKACVLIDRLEEAAGSFEEARTLAHSFPYPYAEARALYQLGRLEQQRTDATRAPELLEPKRAGARPSRKDSEPGQSQLDQALAIFQRLGANPSIERTQRALAVFMHAGEKEHEATSKPPGSEHRTG